MLGHKYSSLLHPIARRVVLSPCNKWHQVLNLKYFHSQRQSIHLCASTLQLYSKFMNKNYNHNQCYVRIAPLSSYSSKNSTSASSTSRAHLEYCVELVKKHDFENYLIGALHIPRRHRTAFFTIHSFNIEIALIRSQGK